MTDIPLYEKAIVFAAIAHKDQKRWSGDPYITHTVRVAGRAELITLNTIALKNNPVGFAVFDFETVKIAAILHDIIEDCNISEETLRKEFGEEVANVVQLVTRDEKDSYIDFIRKIISIDDRIHFLAAIVKLADLRDNTSDLKPDSPLWNRYKPAISMISLYLNRICPNFVNPS